MGGATVLSPALIAGLPQSNAWVRVGPPLFCSGPILSKAASKINLSPGPGAIGPFVMPIRLNPESISPEGPLAKSDPRLMVLVFPARIVLVRITTPARLNTPAPSPGAIPGDPETLLA